MLESKCLYTSVYYGCNSRTLISIVIPTKYKLPISIQLEYVQTRKVNPSPILLFLDRIDAIEITDRFRLMK